MAGARAFLGMVLVCLSAGGAQAACPERLSVSFGDTLSSIARACGISVETLRNANPGLNARSLRAGTFIVVPRAPLPSPQLPVGRPSVGIAPPSVPPATAVSPPALAVPPAMPPRRMPPPSLPGFNDHRPEHLRPPFPPAPLFP